MEVCFLLGRRLALGAAIATPDRMASLALLGFTHIVNLQTDFDDTALARAEGIEVLWNPVLDDLEPKPEQYFAKSVAFALRALSQEGNQVYVHCGAGVRRAPMFAAAMLCGLGLEVEEAVALIRARRPRAEFPLVYLDSVRAFAAGLKKQGQALK